MRVNRGRVQRILRRRSSSPPHRLRGEQAPVTAEEVPQRDERALPSSRALLDRHRRRLASADDLPSLKEIALLLKLERQVEAQETLERLNALTREVDPSYQL
jgi:hypothetical protein